MLRRLSLLFVLVVLPVLVVLAVAQDRPTFRVKVDMVVLSFTITDSKGHYINGLQPKDFKILEDGIPQKLVTFAEGGKPPMDVAADGSLQADPGERGGKNRRPQRCLRRHQCFRAVRHQQLYVSRICLCLRRHRRFFRGLDRADSVAVYSYSRNLTRIAPLSTERNGAVAGLRSAVAGDDSALYNGLLLTLRDAAHVPGRKVVIVFSNGPDNASMVAPDDVRAVAEDEGIPIYVISTNDVTKDPISSNVFRRISTGDGGQILFREDLAEAGGGVRGDPRRSGKFVYGDLLSAAESE